MRIDPIDADTASSADLDAWYEFCRATDRFDYPDDPDLSRPSMLEELVGGENRRLGWVARVDGQIVGGVTVALAAFENSHYAEGNLRVRPDRRRAGIGRALFDQARAAVAADGRTALETWALAGGPGAGFARAMGMRPVLEEVRRVLRMADLNPDAAGWAEGAASRTDGFALVRWAGRCPDDLLEPYARAKDGMNDAPTGEMAWKPVTTTGERVRVREDASARRGWRRYTVAVRELSTGAVAGFTTMLVAPDSPRASQGETTVLERYRGRGFGLWLKAAMACWLTEAEPHVTEHETWNAAENRFMIGVNERLGYRRVDTWQAWNLALG